MLAVETLEGEVFGAFVGHEWRTNWGYYGSTKESFLWRLKHGRNEIANSRSEKVLMDSDLDVYKYSGTNRFVQLCKPDKIAIGGGSPNDPHGKKLLKKLKEESETTNAPPSSQLEASSSSALPATSPSSSQDYGFGLIFEQDLLQGASSPCLTFRSPSLSKKHPRGSKFEILNIEVWTFSPCLNEAEAERVERGMLTSIEQSNTV